ncbi:putative bifunctional diguanylate cyclase/phosphodiesterase [Methylomonas rivi]|uniref:EAL domain-containing protein n=1 Tax=Methylomonas rivi TaxID=2952226 RepID=A0ABT1U819_9GAMM|nr:EAL domain-containing protein [Methylomonas sp. WSC-6]MCQ8129927.1 EAL domain-containing protein [Methylomonas sp. WSC-6]
MNRDEVIPILYEMALTIGGESSVGPLLTRTLQRLLYYTSFPAGFICLDLPAPTAVDAEILTARLDAAVGDYQLIRHVGEQLALPRRLLLGPAAKADGQTELLSGMPATQGRYHAFLRLPIGKLGVIILMAPRMPETELPLTLMFEPIMAHLARAVLLCRNNDQYASQLIADKQRADTRAEFLALHDALTGLPNRGLLLDRIQQAMAMATHSGQYGALMTLNIDHFKQLNDYYGYEACDNMLVETARRLETCIREGDTVARFGGDEFMLLIWPLPATQNEAAIQAEQIAQKIQQGLTPPYRLNGRELSASFSIGISLFRAHLDTLETLLRNAETSVYQAKIAGRNTIRFFDPELQSVIMTRLELEADLLRAMPLKEFLLYYQVQADDQGHITGAEVLIRWRHPRRGLVSPAVFIPLAEETGAIVEIGDWVMQMACETLRGWQQHPRMRQLQLAVNVSAVQFHQPDFTDKVCRLMARYGDIAGLLKLELTESVMLDSAEQVIQKIQILKNLGLRFSLDDFGTGYSSLAYLKRLPLDQLKIDQSFVRDITSDPSAAVIIQTIIGMAQNLGLEVIAEGLETKEQLALLMRYGCRHYQGYLLSKPLPIDAFETLFEQGALSLSLKQALI